ncbi:MAG TPA: amino acid adenylation domain-containing protein [Pyrinomonadaceae bacterium]|nr:amino acid adenylation domain-containing protein [Pyrinomonadaceae bacterium]
MATTALDIRQQLAGLSPAKRALIELKLLKKKADQGEPQPMISRRPEGTPAPLSFYQQGLWVLSQLMPETSLYHVPKAVRLTGALDVAALKKTLDHLVQRHEALRTTFATTEGVPMQVVREQLELALPIVDLSELDEAERELETARVLREETRRPFDLAQGPLIRALLVRLAENEHVLLIAMHHIITDGWSIGIMHREFMDLYEAFSTGQPSPLPELKIQYPDYALWHRQWFQGEVYESQLAYWKDQFKTLPPPLELPTDHPRPSIQAHKAFRGSKRKLTLSKELTQKLKELCQKEEATLFMVLLAAYQVLLHRYTGEEDIVVGSPIAGRCLAETESLIGLFVNALALRVDLSGNPSFRELLGRVKEVALGAYAHQDLPFETLVKEVQPDRTLARNPLFQVMFVLQSESIPTLELPGLTVSHVQVENIVANFDLTLDSVEKNGQLECLLESNADLFDDDTITRLLGHFENLLQGIVNKPHTRISDLPLLSEAERHQLLVEWNDTRSDYPADSGVHALFEQQARATPDAIALIFADETITYRELNHRANQMAHFLIAQGVRAEDRVGICLDRSPALIIAVLGILKAGGAYVPLDPGYPGSRLAFMIEDAAVTLLLTEQKLAVSFQEQNVKTICIDEIAAEVAACAGTNPCGDAGPNSLAYVMYTSGSTGKPKGVAITHKNIVRLVKNTNYADFSSDQVFLQFAPISFDASTFEIWGSLLNGARLALMTPGAASLDELGRALKRYQVTTLWLTAGLFHLMVDTHLDDLRGLKQLLAGGDVLSAPHVRKVVTELKGCRVINGYGPTENTTFTCCYPVDNPAAINGSVPIGRAISNSYVYVLDQHLNPAPIGIPGELYIGGDGVARGYLNQPELTAAKFITDPFRNGDGTQLYKTGDLVKRRSTGELDFLGRIDSQVKVRGYRIELGEVETVLAQHDSVRDAVVLVRKDEGDKHLAAYVVPRAGTTPTPTDLRLFLSERLPSQMVPSLFVVLAAFPLSANGKIDRTALAAINVNAANDGETRERCVQPQDKLELKLQRIWERVLAVSPIGMDDNFFDLGGHSLLAVRLFAQIEKSLGRNLPLATLFQAPTIRLLAEVLRRDGWTAPWSSLVLLQGGGNRRPFFCVHAAGGNVLEYHALAQLLGSDQPFYGFQAQGLDGNQAPHTSIKEMAAHYIREMREVQPTGPYLIGGRSSGGTVAFEMACQLAAAGEQVDLLALLDAYPAGYFKLLPGSASLSQRAVRYAKRIRTHWQNIREQKGLEKLSYLTGKLKFAPAKTKHKIYRRVFKLYKKIGRRLPPVLRNIEELNFAAVKDYVPQVYSGHATLFLASDDRTAAFDVEEGWQGLVAGGLEKIHVSGNHLDIVKEPHVRTLAEKLRVCLDRANGQIDVR